MAGNASGHGVIYYPSIMWPRATGPKCDDTVKHSEIHFLFNDSDTLRELIFESNLQVIMWSSHADKDDFIRDLFR